MLEIFTTAKGLVALLLSTEVFDPLVRVTSSGPKLSTLGDTETIMVGAVPVPVSDNSCVLGDALSETVMVGLTAPTT